MANTEEAATPGDGDPWRSWVSNTLKVRRGLTVARLGKAVWQFS